MSLSDTYAQQIAGQLRKILRTDPVLPIKHLNFRRDLTPTRERLHLTEREWINLCLESQIHTAMHNTTFTKGSRTLESHYFACASSKTSKLTHWNMRQLSGMAGIRSSLGIHPDHWELMALRRTNVPNQAVPDAIIHLKPRTLEAGKQKRSWRNVGLTYFDDIAVEWDSGSATRSDLETKVEAYKEIACSQLWVAPTMARAKTLQDVCCRILEPFHVGILVVDWRTGQCTGAGLPKRGTQLSEILEPTMREVHQPWNWK
jgi:hypothetical protein